MRHREHRGGGAAGLHGGDARHAQARADLQAPNNNNNNNNNDSNNNDNNNDENNDNNKKKKKNTKNDQ